MATYKIYEVLLDLPDVKLDTGWTLDSGDKQVVITGEMFLPTTTIISELDMVITADVSIQAFPVRYVDILPLIPEKFRKEPLLIDFISVLNYFIGKWLGNIDVLQELVDVYRVNEDYITFLAELINMVFLQTETTTLKDLRNQLILGVEGYKIKGTYTSLSVKSYALGFHITIFDMYTGDYMNFTEVQWIATDQNENPVGIPPSYYKSPHFMIEILLDTIYPAETGVLWYANKFIEFVDAVNNTIPIYTVPHYRLFLHCITDESGEVWITESEVKTKVMANWETTLEYLDMDVVPATSSQATSGATQLWYLDDGKNVDASKNSFLQSITKWKMGIGNKGVSPGDTGFSGLANVVLEGDVDTIVIYADRTEYTFTIGSSVVVTGGLSELGLYLTDNTTLQVASTFPDIDKHAGIELKVLVTIYRD